MTSTLILYLSARLSSLGGGVIRGSAASLVAYVSGATALEGPQLLDCQQCSLEPLFPGCVRVKIKKGGRFLS